MQLRPYQLDAINSIYAHFAKSKDDVLLSLPTGAGKSIVIAEFIRGALTAYPTTRVVVATFAKELVRQNFDEFKFLWPDAQAGILSAGLGRKDFIRPIIFAGIQTAYKCAIELGHVDLLIVDEVQAVQRNGNGMWQTFITQLRRVNPNMKIIGLSATLFRMDTGKLYGPNEMFKTVCYEADVLTLIQQGYLSELISVHTSTHLDVRGVGKRGGEYIPSELEKAVDKQTVTQAIIADAVRHGAGRRSWLIFATSISHAEHIRDEVRTYGIACQAVTSKTSKGDRDKWLEDFKNFHLQSLVVIGIGTVGFNHKALDYIIDMRPTGSAGLHIQKLGRGLRVAEGKTNCLVADYSNNLVTHGPIDKIRGTDGKRTDGNGEAPTKVCPLCLALHYAGVLECECGYKFPINGPNLTHRASNAPILSSQTPKVWIPVNRWSFYIHQKPGSPDSLCVEYKCGVQVHREWCCFNHTGFARDKAVRWWSKHQGQLPPPQTVQEAINRQNELIMPIELSLTKSGKYTEIIDRRF